MSISPVPDSAQQLLMDQAWSQTSITEDDTTGTIGMYGSEVDGEPKYYFYHHFQPPEADEWWDGSITEKDFRVIYQMGDTLSDWTGVTLNIGSGDSYNVITAN